jgi:hypothetical protein
LTQRLESQIGGGIAVLVVLTVIFIVLSNLGAIDKAPIDGMSVGAAKYSEPYRCAGFERTHSIRRNSHERHCRHFGFPVLLVPMLNSERAAGRRSAPRLI